MLRESILTELDKNDGLQHVIDIARSVRSPPLILKEVNRKLKVKTQYGDIGPVDWADGLDYSDQFAEIILPMIDQIVTNHQGDFMSPNQQVSMQRPLDAKGFSTYTDKSLQKAIEKIYECLYGKKTASNYL